MTAPERLVAVSQFGSLDDAEGELAKLQRAGLNPYLGGDHYRHGEAIELRVPESQVGKALEVLEIDPALWAHGSGDSAEAAPSCPECGSSNSRRLPPYAFRALVASLVLLGVSIVTGQPLIGGLGVIAGWGAAVWLSRYSGRHRCLAFGYAWKPE